MTPIVLCVIYTVSMVASWFILYKTVIIPRNEYSDITLFDFLVTGVVSLLPIANSFVVVTFLIDYVYKSLSKKVVMKKKPWVPDQSMFLTKAEIDILEYQRKQSGEK